MRRPLVFLSCLLLGIALAVPAVAEPPGEVRFATYNASLNRFSQGDLLEDLQDVDAGVPVPQVDNVLAIIARNDADVLLVNEFDYDPAAGALFAELAGYDHHFIAPSNTGIPSGYDLNNDGVVGGPNDAFGFGFFPGQFGMLLLSRYPLPEARTFQELLWADMPDARLPELDGEPWFTDEELEIVRLSSKSHWDVTVDVPGRKDVHVLASHPTPPVFDGPEDRNGLRNADEIRFWADYVLPSRGDWIVDDDGVAGGLAPGSRFVIAGDLNSDPVDGDSLPGAAQQVLDLPFVSTKVTPTSEGAVEQAILQGAPNVVETAQYDTADFAEPPGNLRVDYVLPSRQLTVSDAGVDWPTTDDPDFAEVGTFPFPASDHRLVWIDVRVN